MSSFRLGYSNKIKYTNSGGQTVRVYDFNLNQVDTLVDLNSCWLCCGRDPSARFAGAWIILTSSGRIVSHLPSSSLTVYNKHERKTYLRLWFFRHELPLLATQDKYTIRVALNGRVPELFLTCGARPYGDNAMSSSELHALAIVSGEDRWNVDIVGATASPPQTQPLAQQHTTQPQTAQAPLPIFQPWGAQPSLPPSSSVEEYDPMQPSIDTAAQPPLDDPFAVTPKKARKEQQQQQPVTSFFSNLSRAK